MPERSVNFLTGTMPTPTFPIPLETWDDHDLEGEETLDIEIARVLNHWGEVLSEPRKRVECQTEFYQSYLGWTGTGIVIPAEVTEELGLKMEHYLEVVFHAVRKGGVETPVYPGRMVEHTVRKEVGP